MSKSMAWASLMSLLVAGCVSYQVVKQATPNPLVQQLRFGVEPLQCDKVEVTEVKLPRELREPESTQTRERPELRAMRSQFETRLDEERRLRLGPRRADDRFVLRAVLLELAPGGIGHIDTTARMKLSIVSGEAIVDEVIVEATVKAAMRREPEERVAIAGRFLADATLDYLRLRTGQEAERPPPPPPSPPPPPPKRPTVVAVAPEPPVREEVRAPPEGTRYPGVRTAILTLGPNNNDDKQRRCTLEITKAAGIVDAAAKVRVHLTLLEDGNQIQVFNSERMLLERRLPGWGMSELCRYATAEVARLLRYRAGAAVISLLPSLRCGNGT